MTAAIIAQKAPFAQTVEAGKTYFWRAGGRSAKQPFRDGSHKAVGMAPESFAAEKRATAYLCARKRSKNAPSCDGTRRSF